MLSAQFKASQAWSTVSPPFQSVEAVTMARVQSQPSPVKASAISLCHPRHWALKVIRQELRSVSLHEISHCLLLLLCRSSAYCPSFTHCCHDPFIVRSTQTCPPFHGFIQLAHPSRCSRSTLTTVSFCFCASVSESAASAPDPSSARFLHLAVECGIHGPQNTNLAV